MISKLQWRIAKDDILFEILTINHETQQLYVKISSGVNLFTNASLLSRRSGGCSVDFLIRVVRTYHFSSIEI